MNGICNPESVTDTVNHRYVCSNPSNSDEALIDHPFIVSFTFSSNDGK